ncbi:MAG: type II toxin-antitoxin system VapC family toxin [Nitrospirota bacterium]
MNAFIDTSSLFKKYVKESNSEKFDKIIQKLNGIVVSPTTLIELHKSVQNRLKGRLITEDESRGILNEIVRDYPFFQVVEWSGVLEKTAIYLVNKYDLKTLDSIQLSCAIISAADQFITSDIQLSKAAEKEIKRVLFV